MVFIIAILVGLFFVAAWGFEAGLFSAFIAYLVGAYYQQRRRLEEVEREVRRVGSILAAMQQNSMPDVEPAGKSRAEINSTTAPACQAKPQLA